MARNKIRWSASQVPFLRRGLAAGIRHDADRQQRLITDSDPAVVPAGFAEGVEAAREQAARLESAELFWVTSDMARVALDAAADIPGVVRDDIPAGAGIMLVSHPLPAIDGLELGLRDPDTGRSFPWTDPVPVDGVAWTMDATGVQAVGLTRSDRLPGTLATGSVLQPFCELAAPVPVPVEFDQITDPIGRSLLSFLASAWILMMIPTLAERKQLDGKWGGPATGQTPPGELVTTVDLRPLRHVADDEPGESGRRLTTRHYVRGHWVNQPHGPGQSLRRLQFRAPHIRGPEGAPLVARDQVKVWRR